MKSSTRRLVRWLLTTIFLVTILFALAGQWKDPWLWAYVGIVVGIGLLGMGSMDDDLARERFSPPSRGEDRWSLVAIRVVALAHVVVGALDSGRLHWTEMPPPLRLAGLLGFAGGFGLVLLAMRANPFFSAVVRVQAERGHHVIDRGPYAIVRHPGYAGMIVAVPFSALALGSWASFAMALVYSLLILRRVRFEDRYLHDKLPGYEAYADRVRYRLVSRVW